MQDEFEMIMLEDTIRNLLKLTGIDIPQNKYMPGE